MAVSRAMCEDAGRARGEVHGRAVSWRRRTRQEGRASRGRWHEIGDVILHTGPLAVKIGSK